MNPALLAIAAGVSFGLWSLVMSLTGLRAGGVSFVLVAGTMLVITPYFLFIRPAPWIASGHDASVAIVAGLGAAALNGLGMVLLPAIINAPPAVVGTRMLVLNLTVVSVVTIWTIAFGEQTLTASKIAGMVLAVAAVWLLGR